MGMCRQYLSECVSTVSALIGRYQLRFTGSADYVLPWTRTRFGEQGFSYCGPATWNTLPSDLHDITDTGTFRKWLKSVLYDRAYHWLLLALLDVSYSGALQISHWLIDGPWPIRKRFTGDHVWQGRSKPGCQIVGSVTIAWLTSGHRSPQPVMTCISERVAQLCCRHDDGDVCVCM